MISGSTFRLTGIATGLDTEQMVKDLMKAERIPLNSLLKKKQLEEWKRDDYREMNRLIANFRDNVMRGMKLQSTFLKKSVISSNDLVVTGTQKGNPSLSSYTIEDIKLFKPGTPHTKSFTTTDVDPSAALGETYTIEITGHVGTKSIEVKSDDSIKSIISKINAVKDETGVVASYNDVDNQFIFTATKNGATTMEITTTKSNKLNISDYTGTAGTDDVNGQVTINGVTMQINSNTFTYDGIQFNLKQTTLGSGQKYTVNVTQDEDAIFDAIQTFVDEYNSLIETLNNKIRETRYRDYEPLLDEEKEAMDEKTIEKWEEKAKSGLLRRDPLISNALSEMRFALYSPVSGLNRDFDTLSEIGITTAKAGSGSASLNYLENGKLYIDEDKLREAIRENGSAVMELFTKTSDATDSKTKFAESGIAQRLYDQLGEVVDRITDKAGSFGMADNSEYYTMGKSMRRLNEEIDEWEDRLQRIEDRYWRQFTALEKAMNQMNAQSAWLAQQFGGV